MIKDIQLNGELLVRSVALGDSLETKVKLYESIINCYLNLKEYSTALAYNTRSINEFVYEDSFRMMDKMFNNFLDMVNERDLRLERLETVEKELKKQQEFTSKALVKVSKWAEEIMNIQEIRIEDFIEESEFERLERRLVEIANDMKAETSLSSMTYTKLRRELLNEYERSFIFMLTIYYVIYDLLFPPCSLLPHHPTF